jgi:RAB protein geranylgeranyltransferase component A
MLLRLGREGTGAGGLSEVAQLACRAGAVGGFVYVLGRDIETVQEEQDSFRLTLASKSGFSRSTASISKSFTSRPARNRSRR